MARRGDVAETDTCCVCLEPYRTPKFLPCHHTFCAECISDVANSHTGGPSLSLLPQAHLSACRGVAALQTNFYISTQKATTAPLKRTHCKVHDDKKLEFYCVKCDEAICLNCKLTKHEQHQTEDLTTAAQQKKQELSTDVARLREAVDKVQKQVKRSKQEQQAVMDKKAAVEKNIHNRHAIMVAAADKFRDEALQSLRSVSADIESDVAKVLKQQQDNLKELISIQQRLQQTIQDGTGSDVIVLSKQMKSGRGSQQAVKKLTSTQLSVISRPVLDFKVTSDVMLQKARDFLGTVCSMKMDYAPKGRIEKRILCGTGADVEVFALCHVDDDTGFVRVSYERLGLKEDLPQILFNEDGSKRCASKQNGKISSKRYAKGKNMFPTVITGRMVTNCKSLTTKHFQLYNQLSGVADVVIVNVLSIEPFKTKTETDFTITIGAHRAFDVDAREQHFVVVEEPQPPDTWRKVRLYHRPGGEPVSTYTPPTPRFQPSDVCFYTLRGQHVLLVTDELNDVIHVVRVEGKEMRLVRYLAPGCPLLIQPTAITVDVEDRLWVACRGGDILTITAT